MPRADIILMTLEFGIAQEFLPDFRRFTRRFTRLPLPLIPPTEKVLSHLAAKWQAFERALLGSPLQ